jgi:putative transposase
MAKSEGMAPSEAKRLKALEDENAKLKRLQVEAMLDIEPLSAIDPRTKARGLEGPAFMKVVTPAARREAVAHREEHDEMGERRACSVLGANDCRCGIGTGDRMTPSCAKPCPRGARSNGGLAIGGCM